MKPGWIDTVQAHLRSSEVLRAVTSVRGDSGRALALGTAPLRSLTTAEVERLEALGNTAEDWRRVRVAEGFDGERVRQSHFRGDVVLGRFSDDVTPVDGVRIPAGVVRSTVVNSVIGHDALVCDVRLLANCIAAEYALLWDCGMIVGTGRTTFGIGQILPLGVETGERSLPVYAEITVAVAAALTQGRVREQLLKPYERLLADHEQAVASPYSIIERGALVRGTALVQDAYLGPHAVVDGAARVENSAILSSADEPAQLSAGVCVKHSLIQWGSHVSDLALVEQSVVLEHARVERQAKVSGSLIGPNTTVAEGEVTASLLGPFIGFHHQALAIAVRWPDGKGNVGHGASAGCNHTSRAPDQECVLGEGVFLGLGTALKYPIDLSKAPYSVVASGVSLPPQKISFPFSLIDIGSPPAGVPPGHHEIVPAWVLSDNLYMLKRSESKFRARDRASRNCFAYDVFRPEMVDLMRDARRCLESAPLVKDVYTERDILGLGKNYVSEPQRRRAVLSYGFFIRYYALLSLLERLRICPEAALGRVAGRLLTMPSTNARWEHARCLLTEELHVGDVPGALRELADVLEQLAQDVERARARDDERGRRIIEDYALVHAPAEQDAIVRQTWDETRQRQQEIENLLARLERPLRVSAPVPTPCDACTS